MRVRSERWPRASYCGPESAEMWFQKALNFTGPMLASALAKALAPSLEELRRGAGRRSEVGARVELVGGGQGGARAAYAQVRVGVLDDHVGPVRGEVPAPLVRLGVRHRGAIAQRARAPVAHEVAARHVAAARVALEARAPARAP